MKNPIMKVTDDVKNAQATEDSRKWYGERFVHSSIIVGVRANIIPFKMIYTLNSTQQSPRTARDLLHLSRPYPTYFETGPEGPELED
jgi:hypothetical protein